MNIIKMSDVLPSIFNGRTLASEVWQSELSFEKGCNYLVSAESGSGKSSLCSYIYGYRSDYSGKITFDDDDISRFDVSRWCELRQRHLAYLPQELRLFPELTAMENVELKNNLTGAKSRKEIEDMFALLGISDKVDVRAAFLSMGQQQRVAIIRALCQPFDFILLDEPVSHLDEMNNRLAAKLIAEEAASQGAGIISTSVGNNVLINVDTEYKL